MQTVLNSRVGFLLFLVVLLGGCENDIERINMLTDESESATIQGTNIKVIYSDSAKVKIQVLAPVYKQYPTAERPYMEFEEGLEVFFYDDSAKIESEIKADYTIYYIEEQLWHATGNVVAQNFENGDALHTEELFWDEKEELIYSDSYTRVISEENTLYGKKGFRSHQNLSNWQLIGSSGTINVQDEE
ncbi:MAG: LPS export ABC transporter periplasmic protein LptC [Bacteroidetes bacterium]|nr:MAG: LPS export ABC transporter periplasmic protein LptC [Bacteroidota bacterium]RLD94009.1 MAG: LPS export ABC transporter periplasmic protein LptC [Bacteroidota bacterium]RLD94988.1 MAG: LPS export ABC transporter periplasmic protein LptC [Bacteroidota bacterium]